MGKAVALDLARKGASLAIVARNKANLEGVIAELKKAAPWPEHQRFKAFSADLTTYTAVKTCFEEVKAWAGVPDIVWQIHGCSFPAFFKDCTPELLEAQLATNYTSVMHIAHVAINMMVDNPPPSGAPKRHIIFTSSSTAFYSFIGYAPYGPAKAAVRSLTDSLRSECLLYDINVACVFPGGITSPGFDEENKTKPEVTRQVEGTDTPQTAEEVSRIAIQRLERGHTLVTTQFISELLRSAAWGGSRRSNLVFDTIMAGVGNLAWWFVLPGHDATVRDYRKKNGVPEKKVVGWTGR